MASYTQLVGTDEALAAFARNAESQRNRIFAGKAANRSPYIHRSAIALKEVLRFFNTHYAQYACNGKAFLIFEALACACSNAPAEGMDVLHQSTAHDCVPIRAPCLHHPDTADFTGTTLLSILWIATKFEHGPDSPVATTFISHCALCADLCPWIDNWPVSTMTLLLHESYIFSLTSWAINSFSIHDIARAYTWNTTANTLRHLYRWDCEILLHERICAEVRQYEHTLAQECDAWTVLSYSCAWDIDRIRHCTLTDIARALVEDMFHLPATSADIIQCVNSFKMQDSCARSIEQVRGPPTSTLQG